MNNTEIKKMLLSLHDCKDKNFSVTMTGKKSRKVNGLYKPATKEILLHNRNFSSENELIFTAIHEFTHHIMNTEPEKPVKGHSVAFWAFFYDLVDKAESAGIYSRARCTETQELIKEAKELQNAIIEAQKKLGEVISKLQKTCTENNERIEDVLEHDLQITREKARDFVKMAGNENAVSDEMDKAIKSAKDAMIQQAAKQAAADGKTVKQVKAIVKAKPKAQPCDNGLDSIQKLRRERLRLEETIDRLNDRLENVIETLHSMEDDEDNEQ